MDKVKIENTVEEIVAPIINEMNYELVHVEYIKEDKDWYLRIYIDSENGINLDDCAKVSKAISDTIDEKDPIKDSYYLEVSSPGPDRPLKKDSDFEKFKGKNILIKYNKPVNGKKSIEGILMDLKAGKIVIQVDGVEIEIDRETTSQIRLHE